MPRRSGVGLEAIAAHDNLARAFQRAVRGKRMRPDAQRFAARLEDNLRRLGDGIRGGDLSLGRFRTFRVFDPKPRTISAPCFFERVLHHAVMAHVGPVLDRALVFDTYACREGKGCLAAVKRAQHHLRRFPFYVKVDMRAYFDSIDHQRLQSQLTRRFKDRGLLALLSRIIGSYAVRPGRGLPIGALTSQHFANTYLAPLDRFLSDHLRVAAMVRYMDDAVAWCRTKAEARSTLSAVRTFVGATLGLELHPRAYVQRSTAGLGFLGFRIYPGRLRLSRRRQKRYLAARHRGEREHRRGEIDALGLQAAYASALAIVAHADSRGFRARDLALRPEQEA